MLVSDSRSGRRMVHCGTMCGYGAARPQIPETANLGLRIRSGRLELLGGGWSRLADRADVRFIAVPYAVMELRALKIPKLSTLAYAYGPGDLNFRGDVGLGFPIGPTYGSLLYHLRLRSCTPSNSRNCQLRPMAF